MLQTQIQKFKDLDNQEIRFLSINKLEVTTFYINLAYIYHIKYIIYTVMIELERMIK